ncbi:hypothetical protein MMC31_008129 [Peltigera leucophlebia]|nr:hypothetical protein [Peltigera leucophlebia]
MSANLPTHKSPSTPSDLTKPFSIALPSSKPKQLLHAARKPLNFKKRPHSSLADSESDDESINQEPQLVSSFDNSAGGAITVNGDGKPKAPLVIQGQRNRDWREETRRKRGKNLLPADVQGLRSGQIPLENTVAEKQNELQEFGLVSVIMEAKDRDGDLLMPEALIKKNESQEEAPLPRTVDEEALDALLGQGLKGSTLILPAIAANDEEAIMQNRRSGVNEDDSFRSDVASRPDSASLDEYAAVPIEEFGAALLRGMGWKEGDAVGKRKNQKVAARVVERRPALLGIGAKEVPGGVEELGAWGKTTTNGKRKVEKAYTPVLLRNTRTGEILTEEELEAKQEAQKREDFDWRERRDRNLAIDEVKKSERKDRGLTSEDDMKSERRRREKKRDYEESRKSSTRRRSRSPDHKRSRRRDEYDKYERREKGHHSQDRRGDDRDESRSSRHTYQNRDYEDARRRSRQAVS